MKETGGIDGLAVLRFHDAAQLESWLQANHRSHRGIWLRLSKNRSTVPSVSFEEVLELGLASTR